MTLKDVISPNPISSSLRMEKIGVHGKNLREK
jgi:hypothetical protein